MDPFSPLQLLADQITYHWFHLSTNSYLGSSLNFFIYDTLKIGLLLIVINYIMAITRYYFPIEKVRDILTLRNWYGFDYLLAALLGVITPFCSCSSIPLFIGFLSAGIPLGVTFSFLISSPLVNESSLYLFPAIFGLKNTLLYNAVGILISVIGGIVIQRLNLESSIRPEFLKFKSKKQLQSQHQSSHLPLLTLFKHWSQEAKTITIKIFPYVLLGVGIGALIHGLVPEVLVTTYLSSQQWWVVPLAVIFGSPLYANSVSVVPITEALIGKGIPMGTALAFMTATVTISIPEALMLSKLMEKKLLAAFFLITILGIIFMGYLFNFISL